MFFSSQTLICFCHPIWNIFPFNLYLFDYIYELFLFQGESQNRAEELVAVYPPHPPEQGWQCLPVLVTRIKDTLSMQGFPLNCSAVVRCKYGVNKKFFWAYPLSPSSIPLWSPLTKWIYRDELHYFNMNQCFKTVIGVRTPWIFMENFIYERLYILLVHWHHINHQFCAKRWHMPKTLKLWVPGTGLTDNRWKPGF